MIYHLSHIDLDGYFCQYLSTKKFTNVKYFNSNYGKEIKSNLKKIFKQASISDIIFITDLNLEQKECEYVQSFIDKGYTVKLYDHHIAGEKFANRYDWYYLDTTKSASAIFSEKEMIDTKLLTAVNSYDMWEETADLDLGCYLSEFINKDYLFYFNEDKIKFFNKHFKYIESYYETGNFSIEQLEKVQITLIHSEFMMGSGTLKQKLSRKYKEDMLKMPVQGKYIFLFNINREYFQYISQYLLADNPRLIIVLISKNGRLSFRSKNEDVNELASNSFNGSGHRNASGGTLQERNILNKEEGISYFLNSL